VLNRSFGEGDRRPMIFGDSVDGAVESRVS